VKRIEGKGGAFFVLSFKKRWRVLKQGPCDEAEYEIPYGKAGKKTKS